MDFVILKENQIEELIEVKFSEETISRSLQYYAERLTPPRHADRGPFKTALRPNGKIRVTNPFSYFTPKE